MNRQSLSPKRANTQPAARLDLLRAFALKTTSKPYRLIDAHNEVCSGFLTLDEALASGHAFYGEVLADILAVDADTAPAVAALAHLADRLKSAGLDPILVAPGRPDHQHLFVRIRDADTLAQSQDLARTMRLTLRHTIRPPLSPHRSGLPVSLVDPHDPAEALASLSPKRPLPPRIQASLRDGAEEPRRSQAIQRVALAAYCRSWTCDEFIATILGSPLAAKAVSKHRDPHQYLRHCWGKAREYAASPRVNREREQGLASILAAVNATVWRKQAGVTDRDVLLAHVMLAREARSLTFQASVRQIVERAGISLPTVIRSRTRLRWRGWLTPVRVSRTPTEAGTWRLHRPSSLRPQLTPFDQSKVPSMPFGGCVENGQRELTRPPHDLWRWNSRKGGLGKSTARVYAALPLAVDQVPALAMSLGVKPPAVWHHLRKLVNEGLAQKDHGGWGHTDRTVDHAIVGRAVAGERSRQRQQHVAQRQQHVATLEAMERAKEDEASQRKRRERQRLDDLFRSGRAAALVRTAASRQAAASHVYRAEGGYHSQEVQNADHETDPETGPPPLLGGMQALRDPVEPVPDDRAGRPGVARTLRSRPPRPSGLAPDRAGERPAPHRAPPGGVGADRPDGRPTLTPSDRSPRR